MNKTLNTALILANAGLKVYPLTAGSKVPVKGSHGEHDATSDPETIKHWFNYDPNFNLAINLKTSSLAVIDLDNHTKGTNGVNNWSRYLTQHGTDYVDSAKTYAEYTPQNGLHMFYKVTQELPSEDIKLLPGVELLTGKVTIAPSYINQYQRGYYPAWQGFPSLNSNKLLPLPQWIVDLAKQKQPVIMTSPNQTYQGGVKRWTGSLLDTLVHGTTQGDRNNFLTSLTGKMFRVGADSDTVYNLLVYANGNCEPSLPDKEVNNIFASILKKNGGQ